MTLSQTIARNAYFDVEIPSEGKWKVYMVIQDGQVKLQDVTEQRKFEDATIPAPRTIPELRSG